MQSQQLTSVVITACVGSMGVWGVNAVGAIDESAKTILRAGIIIVTISTMARFGGLF